MMWMELMSSITACRPLVPTNAAEVPTLRSPRSMLLDVQDERLPDSKPSAKIKSVVLGVFVTVGVAVGVGVFVDVGEGPGVGVFVRVNVAVGVVSEPEDGAVISYILPSMILGSLLLSIARSTM